MSAPKRPEQGRSAVPEFTEGDFAVHDMYQGVYEFPKSYVTPPKNNQVQAKKENGKGCSVL